MGLARNGGGEFSLFFYRSTEGTKREVGTFLVLRSKAIFANADVNSAHRVVDRVMFGASVAKCLRMLASPSCTKRTIIVACPLVKGCKVAPSVRSTEP